MYEYSRRPNKFKKFMLIFLLMVIVSGGSIFVYSMYTKIDVKDYTTSPEATATRLYNETALEEKEDFSSVLEEVTKGVVGISKIKNTGTAILDSNATKELGLGSGIIVSENGYIVTNWHVAGNKYSTCYVTLENGEIYSGNVTWADSDLDLAIVKINAKGLKYLELGDSDKIKLGQEVCAIGNPIGIEFQRTVTAGIISGLDRTIKIEDTNGEAYMEDLIQTDASINSGNSGGPLIDKDGKVIGINSIKITSAEGIGFAIPINIIKPVIESYIQNDKFEEAYLGIFAYDTEVNKYLNSNLDFNNGIYVVKISSDGPAAKSGLKVGDIITKIDDYTINKMSELRNYIYTKAPNNKVVLTINRNNKEYTVNITLGKR
ncbi:MAG: trypsin-like peptidase domain-containing protein [Clostridia bacterium]|nr:trypsin-like peptidase domain-containing protein [Clostridia bacterium]